MTRESNQIGCQSLVTFGLLDRTLNIVTSYLTEDFWEIDTFLNRSAKYAIPGLCASRERQNCIPGVSFCYCIPIRPDRGTTKSVFKFAQIANSNAGLSPPPTTLQ